MRFINQLEPTHTHHTKRACQLTQKTSAKSTARSVGSVDAVPMRSQGHFGITLKPLGVYNPLKIRSVQHISAMISAWTGDDSAIFRLPIVKGYIQGFLIDSFSTPQHRSAEYMSYIRWHIYP